MSLCKSGRNETAVSWPLRWTQQNYQFKRSYKRMNSPIISPNQDIPKIPISFRAPPAHKEFSGHSIPKPLCHWVMGWFLCFRLHHELHQLEDMSSVYHILIHAQQNKISHRALSLWEDEPINDKEFNRLSTSPSFWNSVSIVTITRYIVCVGQYDLRLVVADSLAAIRT